MFNILLQFGMPFDCTSNPYWIEPSSSLKRDKTIQKVLKFRLSKIPVSSYADLIKIKVESSLLPGTEIFNTDVAIPDIVIDQIIEEKNHQLEMVRLHKSPSAVDRFFWFFEDAYHIEFENYLIQANPRILTTWFVKRFNDYTTKHCPRLFPTLETGQAIDFEKMVLESLPKERAQQLLILTNYIMSYEEHLPNTMAFCNVMLCAFICLDKDEYIAETMVALWLVSYNSIVLRDLFGLVLYHFKDKLPDYLNQFPFLSGAFLQFYFDYLDTVEEGAGITNYERHLVFNLFTSHVVPQALKKPDAFEAYLSIKAFIERIDFNANTHVISKLQEALNGIQEDVLSQQLSTKHKGLATFISADKNLSLAIEYKDTPYAEVVRLNTQINNLIISVFYKYTDVFQACIDDVNVQLITIDEQSKTLASNPLDNINELQKLAEERAEYQLLQKTNKQQFTSRVEQLVDELYSLISTHNHKHQKRDDPLIEENYQLKSLLTDAELQIATLTQEQKELSDKLLKAQLKPDIATEPTPCGIQFDDMVTVLESKTPIVDIVTLIANKRPWVKISDKLIKSLSDIKSFARTGELARYLITLTSPEFISAYNNQGSAGAFSFFSKTTLSFQESETTMAASNLRAQREFTFSGKKHLCVPHLKIGINNTQQQQLRIHFKLEGETDVYIGYIGRHLQTGAV